MIVILEGPDNSGKTHLANQLTTRIIGSGGKVDIVHHGPPAENENVLQTYLAALHAANLRKITLESSTIFDRLAMSEVVYGSIIRGGHKLGREGYRKFAETAEQIGAKTVILTTPWDTVCDLWKARQATEYVKEKGLLFDIWEAYQSRAHNLRSPGVVPIGYDWTTMPLEALWQELTQ